MLKECNDQDLDRNEISGKYYLFFQVWKELTERKTLDSYQYRIMNSLEALSELSVVIGYKLNRFYNTNHNIDECKAETKEIIGTDQVIKMHYPNIWRQLMAHLSEKSETDAQQRALRYQIEYSYNILSEHYFEYLIDDLETEIENSDKENIIKKTSMLISNCATRGWSTLALHNLVDILYDSKTDLTKWGILKNRLLNSTAENYCIYIPLRLKLKVTGSQSKTVAMQKVHNEITDMGIALKTKPQLLSENNLFEEALLKESIYMVISVSAFDYYSATYKAIDRCTDILNILSFYNFIEAWNVKGIRCLAVNVDNGSLRSIREKDLYATYDYIESSQKIYRTSKNVYSLQNTSVHKKLHDVYAYVNMAKASSAQEEKFMNMWIALESLCRGDVYENIISNVLETVPPALCLRYIYQHFRNFVEDCLRCNIDLSFSFKRVDTSLRRDKEEVVKDIIEVFNDTTLYNELLSKCAINDLLEQRCKELHVLATDKNVMFNKIERHYSMVRRQLSRLYRIRNDIAHNAMTSAGTLMLYIEHLEAYLTGFVAEIVMCAEKKQLENIEVIFEIIKDNYKVFLDIIRSKKNSDSTLLLDGLLKSGVINLI